jgi:hypothetical protein
MQIRVFELKRRADTGAYDEEQNHLAPRPSLGQEHSRKSFSALRPHRWSQSEQHHLSGLDARVVSRSDNRASWLKTLTLEFRTYFQVRKRCRYQHNYSEQRHGLKTH